MGDQKGIISNIKKNYTPETISGILPTSKSSVTPDFYLLYDDKQLTFSLSIHYFLFFFPLVKIVHNSVPIQGKTCKTP
jgi:hypothetical protein